MGDKQQGNWTGEMLAGRYRLGHKLGRGGIGVVYEAMQQDLKRRVAVKLLHPHLATDGVNLERFRREAQSAGGLGHPNIVGVTDFQHREGEPAFIVMEYLEGRTLEEELRASGPMAPERVSFIVQQVLSALSAAHAEGIIHRDLKPGNIFLTSVAGMSDIVKILDFGVAKVPQSDSGVWTSVTGTGETLGTPSYMAPEQAMGEDVDGRSDLFTLGVVMYRAITGRLPFDGPNPAAQLQAVVHEPARRLRATMPSVDPRIDYAVHRALQKRKEDRFPDAAAMKAALEADPDPVADPATAEEPASGEVPTTIDKQPGERTADIRRPPAPPSPVPTADTKAAKRPRKRPARKPTLVGLGADWDDESTRRVTDAPDVKEDFAVAARQAAAQRAQAEVLARQPPVVDAEDEATAIDSRPAELEKALMKEKDAPPSWDGDGTDTDVTVEEEDRELPDSEPPTRPRAPPPQGAHAPAPPPAAAFPTPPPPVATPAQLSDAAREAPPVPQAPTPASVRSKASRAGRVALWTAGITAVVATVGGLAAWRWLGAEDVSGASATTPPASAQGEGGEGAGTGAAADPGTSSSTAVAPAGDEPDAAAAQQAATTDAGAAEPANASDADAGAKADAAAQDTASGGDTDEPEVDLPEVPDEIARLSERRRSIAATRLRSRGNRLYARRHYARAETLYRKSLQYYPQSAATALGMARALTRQGDRDAALPWAKRSVRLEPERSLAHVVLGDLLRTQGDVDAAQEHYEEAVRIEPRNRVARKRLWRIKRR